jgi:hypothetical protein
MSEEQSPDIIIFLEAFAFVFFWGKKRNFVPFFIYKSGAGAAHINTGGS